MNDLLRPDSTRNMMRSVLTRRQRIEFSREFESPIRPKSSYGASGRSNSLENLLLPHPLSALCSDSSPEFDRSRAVRCLKNSSARCYTLVTPVTPTEIGCKPCVHRHCHTVTPYYSKFPAAHARESKHEVSCAYALSLS